MFTFLVRPHKTIIDGLILKMPVISLMNWQKQSISQCNIDYDRVAELGVTIGEIGRTLETMLVSRRVTTFLEEGEEYDVTVEGESSEQRTPSELKTSMFVHREQRDSFLCQTLF